MIALTAVTTAFFGPTPLWLVAAAAAVLVASPLVGGVLLGLRMVAVAVAASVGALVLLFPWPLEFPGADGAALGFAFRPDLGLSEVLRF